MSIEEIACSKLYSEIIREERNFAAILYAALCRKGNIAKFIKLCGFDLKVGKNPAVYFEYSYLRDWWHQIIDTKEKNPSKEKVKAANDKKLRFIKKHLNNQVIVEKYIENPHKFNKDFGVAGRLSKEHIQYPGKWSIKYLKENFKDEKDLRDIVKFKWACNVKPDIVIRVDDDEGHYICIETKYDSRESMYSLDEGEKRWTQKQTYIQKYLMEDLLGYRGKTKYVFINKSGKKKMPDNGHEDFCCICWKQAFKDLEVADLLDDVNRIIETCTKATGKLS